jgi:uncharacterized protein (TIGR03437 family)
MKFFALLLSLAAAGLAADFTTGQAARLVIGQVNFTSQDPTSTQAVLGGVSGIAYSNGRLIVADSNRVGAAPDNNRVLIFNSIGSSQIISDPKAEIPPTGARCPACLGSADVVLGQPDFTKSDVALTANGMRLPTAVATDGTHLVVADTDNNRVLIWNTIPTAIQQPADVVVGQDNFTSNKSAVTAKNLRGPQGVWIQAGKLYVADTMNNRVLVWNSIPTGNGQSADVVLGQPNFTTLVPIDLLKQNLSAAANDMLTPVSVTSDGTHLFVGDLGYNRVLVWNSIPTSNQQPADLAVGQPDMVSANANNSAALCASNGTDTTTNTPTYPARCAGTLNFPRFALSDGKRLFIADGGNDRVLVYNSVPTTSGYAADFVLGQPDAESNNISDYLDSTSGAASNIVRTPLSLAWDGTNLFVSDAFNRRIVVFSVGDNNVPLNGIRNGASGSVFANGSIVFSGTIKEADQITISIGDASPKTYQYTITKTDTLSTLVDKFVSLINAFPGDPLVYAIPNNALSEIILVAKQPDAAGNGITVSNTLSASPSISVATTSTSGGQSAAQIGPGTIVTILGNNLADAAVAAPANADPLPTTLGTTQVYLDGRQLPLLYVSPKQINAQVPFDIGDSTSGSLYVRSVHADKSVTVTTPVAVPIVLDNPGIFAQGGAEPRPAIAYHSTSNAQAIVSVDGAIKAGDTATITIDGQGYTYTVLAADTLFTVRDALVGLINANTSARVTATSSNAYSRIIITAKAAGAEGNGITVTTSTSTSSTVILSAFQAATCCYGTAGTLVTTDNPAIPGEIILIYATGLGVVLPDEAKAAAIAGSSYQGPAVNVTSDPVSALAGALTAQVISAGLKPGMIGVYEVAMQLASNLPTNDLTQVTIAQGFQVSNTVTIPVKAP